MSTAIDFASRFLRGEMDAFPMPVEDCDALAALCSQGDPAGEMVEAALMALAHGDCHDLTLALAEALGLDEVLLIRDAAGMPVHSGLYNQERDLLLDANGVHTRPDAEAFWSHLSGEPCTSQVADLDYVMAISSVDEDAAAIALEDFELICGFIETHGLAHAPLESPCCSM